MENMQVFAVNKPEVVAEVIDGELVAIQLRSGCYYHANPAGALVWKLMEAGVSTNAIIEYLKQAYPEQHEQISVPITVFLEQLVKEELIRAASDEPIQLDILQVVGQDIPAYQEPLLTKHEDMKELLLLDPIHDIGEKTWPISSRE